MKVLVVSLHPVTGHSLEYKRNPKPLGPIHLVHIQYQHYLIHRSHKMTTFVVANGVLNIVLIILFTKQKHKQETHKNSYAFFRDSLFLIMTLPLLWIICQQFERHLKVEVVQMKR